MNQLFSSIGQLIFISAGAAATCFALMRWLGEKWLSSKFERAFAKYKHELDRDLEQVKFEINKLMDRTIKLHQYEFDVLPELWMRVVDVKNEISVIISPHQSYPDVDRMNNEELIDFAESSFLDRWQKEELLKTDRKTDYFADARNWHRLKESETMLREFHVYLMKNGIFVSENIKDQFKILDDMLWYAITEHKYSRNEISKDSTKREHLAKNGDAEMTKLEKLVQQRLWSLPALDGDVSTEQKNPVPN